jgi:integrase
LGDVAHKPYLAAKNEARDMLDAGRRKEDLAGAQYVAPAAGQTLEQAVEAYCRAKLTAVGPKRIKPNTAADLKRVLRFNLGDWYGRRLASVTREEVRERNGAIMRRSASMARATFTYLNAVINFLNTEARLAGAREPYPSNPVAILKDAEEWAPKKKRNRIIAPESLPAWWAATGRLDQERARDYLRLCLLTAMRKNEAAALEWRDVDFARRSYRVRGAEQVNPETGELVATPKNANVIENPITREVGAILRARYEASDRDERFVFPGNKDRERYTKSDKAVTRVVAMSGIEWSMHDLRRTWRTFAVAKARIQKEEAMRLMNHKAKDDGPTGDVSYDYFAAPVEMMREAAQAVEDALLACCRPKGKRAKNVVPMRKAA